MVVRVGSLLLLLLVLLWRVVKLLLLMCRIVLLMLRMMLRLLLVLSVEHACSSRCVHIGHGIVSGRGLRMMVGGSIVVRRSRSRRIGVGGPVVASRDHVRVVRVMLRHLAGAVVFI